MPKEQGCCCLVVMPFAEHVPEGFRGNYDLVLRLVAESALMVHDGIRIVDILEPAVPVLLKKLFTEKKVKPAEVSVTNTAPVKE